MKTDTTRETIAVILAVISLFADILGLYHFFATETAMDFFSLKWLFGFAYIFGLLFLAATLLGFSGLKSAKNAVLVAYGLGFFVISIVFYSLYGYKEIKGLIVDSQEYWGYAITVLIFCLIAVVTTSMAVEDDDYVIFERASYFFAFSSLGIAILMGTKYLGSDRSIFLKSILSEIFVVAYGAIILIILFSIGQTSTNVRRQKRA